MATLEEMEDRARRHLDGMTVNRDAMAKDVLQMGKALRSARDEIVRLQALANRGSSPFGDDFLNAIFGRRKGGSN